MIVARKIRLLLQALFHKKQLDAEMDEEMRLHVEMQAEENVQAGMKPEAAHRAAAREFGAVESLKESCREGRGFHGAESLVRDAGFALRMLRKNPGFTAVSVLTLALGIGANTAIFSVINSVLLRPLPYHDPERLVTVCESNLKRGYPQVVVAPANLRDWTEQSSVFEELGGQIYTSLTLSGIETPEHLHAAWTTPNFFSVFGVPPFLGRTFIVDDKPPAGHRVAVLSYNLWERSFAGDRTVIGKTITLSGLIYTVVGVMPRDFRIFNPAAVFGLPTGAAQPQLWAPYPGSMGERTNRYFLAFGRLKPGVTLPQAQASIHTISERVKQEFPSQQDWGSSVQPLNEQILGASRPVLRLLLGTVVFVLLIACANVANLSLARSVARGKEFAIRSALGAARLRLVCQMLVESTIVAILGGCLGVLLARCSLAGLMALQPASLPRLNEIRLDGSVLLFALLISFLTGLVFGLAPAIQTSKPNLNKALSANVRGASTALNRQRLRNALVVSEVALAMVLLASGGLMIASFVKLTGVSPGFEPEHLMTLDVSPAGRNYAEDAERMRLVKQLRDGVAAHPGVASAAAVYGLPFGTMLNSLVGVNIEGRSTSDPRERASAGWRVVSPSYFSTMSIRFLAGRAFSEVLDGPESPPAAIVNETFARKYFHDEDPIGRRIQVFPISTNWYQIVGIIKDVKLTGLDSPATPEVYQSDSQNAMWMFSLVVRSFLPSGQVEKIVRAQLAPLDKGLPLFNVRTMEQAISASVASPRFLMLLIGLFAALALVLTAVGIYGVVSYSVGQRTREIGIRMALGAPRRIVLGLVLGQGMKVALVGIGIGLAGSLALTRLIANQLFEVSPTDPATFVLIAVLLALVATAACYLPARRATKVDPMLSLRYE